MARKGYKAVTNGLITKYVKDSKLFLDSHKGWRLGIKDSEAQRLRTMNIGKPLSEDRRKAISIRQQGSNNSFYGHKQSEKHRIYQSNHNRLHPPTKGIKLSKEARAIRSKVQQGSNNSFYGRKHSEKSKRMMSKSRTRIMSNNPNLYSSRIERAIVRYLSNYFEVIPQFYISSDYYHPYDMLVKLPGVNLLIEYDGDYYHKGKQELDKLREINAIKYGYKFLVIKESDYYHKGEMKYVKKLVSKFYPEFLNMHLIDKKS